MTWHARLQLHYRREGERTVAHDRHEGPLRVLQRLYPEGPAICHHVLVHPPGGVAGGDVLEVDARLEPGTHALLTTPGATRFYRSDGALAAQRTRLSLAPGSRAEWLPLEALAYPGCRVENRLRLEPEAGAELIAWDCLALGLPAAGQPFERGQVLQHLELPGQWLEFGRIDAEDHTLLQSPLGWAGHTVLATLVFAAGEPLAPARVDALLAVAREQVDASPLATTAGATQPCDRVVVLRALAPHVEPAMALLTAVRGAWRLAGWQLDPQPPRLWRM